MAPARDAARRTTHDGSNGAVRTTKSDLDRGPIGSWARIARLEAGYPSADKAAAAITAAGVPLDGAYLRGIEAGHHRPSSEILQALATLYGAEPPNVSSDIPSRLVEEIKRGTTEEVLAALEPRLARLERLLERLADDQAPSRPSR